MFLKQIFAIGGWIITSGYHSGISKDLAHKMRREGFLNPKKKVVMMGITDWNTIAGKSRLIKNCNDVSFFIFKSIFLESFSCA